jgi:predicted ATPase/class 3 adenylate cyclase
MLGKMFAAFLIRVGVQFVRLKSIFNTDCKLAFKVYSCILCRYDDVKMSRKTLYSGAIYSILSPESTDEYDHIFKSASLSSLSQLELLKFTNEASFRGNQITGFREVLANEISLNEYILKLQYISGYSLEEVLSKPLNLFKKLKLCIAIAKRLSEVHCHDVVHLNLNPKHIIIDHVTGNPFFISLGLATRLQRKIPTQNRLVFTEADADFIAPEQTGRISSDIGFYSDIYSMGIIFYWIFTEKLPFESKLEFAKIHAHLAITPKAPIEISGTPEIISNLIMRMLEKEVRKRYQSADGIVHDLSVILNGLEQKDQFDLFELGTQDAAGIVRFPDRLYGREEQFIKLKETFQRVLEKDKILLLVYGNSGVGKSSLVEELHLPVIQEGGFFVSGKSDPLKTDVPYFAFSQAFSRLMDHLLLLNEIDLSLWKQKLYQSLHPIGRVLFDIIPGLAKLLENEPDLPELNGLESQLRFNYALTNFFRVFSESDKPLVFFIDDLQWIDSSSLNLIRTILTNDDFKMILIIGAYRDNEITMGHVFLHFKMEMEELGILSENIHLENLQYRHVFQLISDALDKTKLPLDELVKIVYKKSGGNALFVNQFIKAIYANEMLIFDRAAAGWKWDSEKIIGYNVEGDIVNLFLHTINQLPEETIFALKLASCIGNKFSLGLLAIITKEDKESLYQKLRPALQLDLIIEGLDDALYFVHDRVQQAIYSLNDERGKSEFHLRIGRLLLENTPEEELRDFIFDIVNQFNLSTDLITDPSEARTLCELNLIAGQRSQSATAYSLALQYYEKALHLLAAYAWEQDKKFVYNLHLLAAEAANQCNKQERFQELITILDEQTVDLIDKLKLADLKIQNANVFNHQQKVIEIGLQALRVAHIHLKHHPSTLDVLSGYLKTNFRLGFHSDEKIENLPKIEDERIIICMSIMHHMALAAYFIRPNMVPLIMFELVRLTLTQGLGPKSPFAFVVYGYINIAFMNRMEKGLKMGQLGYRLFEILNHEDQEVSLKQVYHMFISQWLVHLGKSIPDLENAFKKGLETGDFEFTSIIGQLIIYWNFYGGEPIEKVLKRGALLSMQVAPLNQIMQIERINLFRQSVVGLVDGVDDFEVLSGSIFDENKITFLDEPAFGLYYHNLYCQKKLLCLVYNQHEMAWKFCQKEKEYLVPVKGSVTEMLFFFYENLCITPIYNSRTKKEQEQLLRICQKNLRLIKGLLAYSEVNYRHRYELMSAEYYTLLGQFDQALKAYTYAIRYARLNKYIQDEAVAWERTGLLFISQNQPEAAQFYLSHAYKAYLKWGANAKLLQMKEMYAGYISLEEIGLSANTLDLETILKTINLISGESVQEKILTGLMKLVTENAGAERAFLVIKERGKMIIKASLDLSINEIDILSNHPLEGFVPISHSVVNYVARTGEVLVLEDATTLMPFSSDAHVLKNDTKSIICLPLKHAGTPFAYLYLENRFISGAFTPARVEILQVIATQTAISLQSAMLLERTTQLNEELTQEVFVRKAVEENLRTNEKRLEEYNTNLEFKVQERTRDLQSEQEKTNQLLLNILPADIARELKEKGGAQAKKFESVSVLFTDFKGFSMIAEKMSASELVSEIDYCFKEFDRIIQKYQIEKIKTIGDAYMAVGGLPVTNETHSVDVIKAGLEIRDFIESHKMRMMAERKPIFEIRIGIHTGNVVAGIVGLKKFAYDIWGDTVNVAARMESSGEVGKVNISGTTYELVKDHFTCMHRGKVKAKNKGEIDMYFVEPK